MNFYRFDVQNNMEDRLAWLQKEHPRTYNYLYETVNKINGDTTFEDACKILRNTELIFDGVSIDYETFLYIFWKKVSEFFGIYR